MAIRQFRLINTEKGILNIQSDALQDILPAPPVKAYQALLLASLTGIAATEQSNTTGLSFAIARVTTGTYRFALDGDLTNKIAVYIDNCQTSSLSQHYINTSITTNGASTFIFIRTWEWNSGSPTGTLTDDILENTAIRIEIYDGSLPDANDFRIINLGKGIQSTTANNIQSIYNGLLNNYLEYVALITQSGTNVPVPQVVKNSLPFIVTPVRNGVGNYRFTFGSGTGDLTNQIAVIVGQNVNPISSFNTVQYSLNYDPKNNRTILDILTTSPDPTNTAVDNVLDQCPLKIIYIPNEI